jgi:hypothetical protein
VIVAKSHILRSVIATLRNEVLPNLEAATPTASYVRASLMMLTNLEQRDALEPALLRADNQELRELMRQALDPASQLNLDAGLRGELEKALASHDAVEALRDPGESARLNHRYQELLTHLIARLGSESGAAQSVPKVEFKRSLRCYLENLSARDTLLVETALAEAPV